MLRLHRALLLLTPLLILACSEDVEVPPDGDGGAGGSGGATASTSGSGGSGGSGGGGAPATCGGFAGMMCEGSDVCVWPDGLCGGNDGMGECQPRPEGCPEDCPGVCGCDGKFYCNACGARQEGVDVAAGVTSCQ